MTIPKVLIVSVDFDDLLAITLPRNRRSFGHVLVATSPNSEAATRRVCESANASVFVTDAFYRDGAKFNKGLAIEEGLDVLGRDGWILCLDADVVLPAAWRIDLSRLDTQCLYGARRRVIERIEEYTGQDDWGRYPIAPDRELPGYLHLFHASASALQKRPWVGVNWAHAGGYDSDFEKKFRPDNTRWLPYEVLHLGPTGTNWYGRSTPRIDGTVVHGSDQHRNEMRVMRRIRRRTGRMDHERVKSGEYGT